MKKIVFGFIILISSVFNVVFSQSEDVFSNKPILQSNGKFKLLHTIGDNYHGIFEFNDGKYLFYSEERHYDKNIKDKLSFFIIDSEKEKIYALKTFNFSNLINATCRRILPDKVGIYLIYRDYDENGKSVTHSKYYVYNHKTKKFSENVWQRNHSEPVIPEMPKYADLKVECFNKKYILAYSPKKVYLIDRKSGKKREIKVPAEPLELKLLAKINPLPNIGGDTNTKPFYKAKILSGDVILIKCYPGYYKFINLIDGVENDTTLRSYSFIQLETYDFDDRVLMVTNYGIYKYDKKSKTIFKLPETSSVASYAGLISANKKNKNFVYIYPVFGKTRHFNVELYSQN